MNKNLKKIVGVYFPLLPLLKDSRSVMVAINILIYPEINCVSTIYYNTLMTAFGVKLKKKQ